MLVRAGLRAFQNFHLQSCQLSPSSRARCGRALQSLCPRKLDRGFLSPKTGNAQHSTSSPSSSPSSSSSSSRPPPGMDASPHPNRVGRFAATSPVTPPTASSAAVRKYSAVPACDSDRAELIRGLAQEEDEGGNITLSQEQLAYCREALVLLTKKLNAFVGRRRLIDKGFESLQSDKVPTNKYLARTTIARLEANYAKNRYMNVLPYDDTRVVLDESRSSYINANYVLDLSHEKLSKFIATQQPLPNTSADFWEMISQQQCPVIVMLTELSNQNSKAVKCDNYFPPVSQESQTHGQFKIINKHYKISENAVAVRLLEMKRSQLEDLPPVPVLHLQIDWPDYGVPTSSLGVRTVFKTLYRIPADFGPFVVHCSAGIGRTGTFCTIDHTLRRIFLGDLSAVNIENTVRNFRQQRYGMVQTTEQYAFCFTTVIQELEDLIVKHEARHSR